MDNFAKRLLKARTLRKYSQEDLARICGISQSAISNYERGERAKSNHIFELAKALEVNLYWLNNGTGQMLDQHHQLNENISPWPFPDIDPNKFWALKTKNRQLIEKTVAVMIEQLTDN